jgi:hypothetical protein
MKNLSVVAFAVAAVLCATPLSLRWSHSNVMSLSAALDSAQAAELNVPIRHHRTAVRYGHSAYYARLYDRWCGGPYTGGGWNGGAYYGGPWIDLRCYGTVD